MKFRQTRFWQNYRDYIKISGDSSMRGFVDGLLFWKLLTRFDQYKNILEIGSCQGLTTGLLFDCLPDAWICSVDPVDNMELFRSHYQEFLDRHRLLIMQSQAVSFKQNFDLIFIDGDHNYSPCLSDIEMALQHINSSGLLIIDDFTTPGVSRAIKDLYAMDNDWVPFMQGIQTQFWHHRSQDKSIFLDELLADPISNFLLMRNIKDDQNNVILQAECVRMLTDHYDIFDQALILYDT